MFSLLEDSYLKQTLTKTREQFQIFCEWMQIRHEEIGARKGEKKREYLFTKYLPVFSLNQLLTQLHFLLTKDTHK